MPSYQRILLQLSGEALMGDDAFGINRAPARTGAPRPIIVSAEPDDDRPARVRAGPVVPCRQR